MTLEERLETQVMAHRYRYYVLAAPVISDFEYDDLERRARAVCAPQSPVHGVGSSLASSYTAQQISLATQLGD